MYTQAKSTRYSILLWAAWVLVICVSTATLVWVALSSKWMSDTSNSGQMAYLGLLLAVVGLILTLAGFGVTFQQLLKVRSNTQETEAALVRARLSIAALSSTSDIEKARNSLESARQNFDSENILNFQNDILELRGCLYRISLRKPEKFSVFMSDIDKAVIDIASTCDQLDSADVLAFQKLRGWLRPYVDLVEKLHVRITEV